jgi:hypothetical protein
MKPTELRIGNLLKLGDLVYSVSCLYKTHFTMENELCIPFSSMQYNFVGIPLTEEWLLKFGFKKTFRGKFEHDLLTYDIYGGDGLYIHGCNTELKHVHQLQNLYFALTQTELTLNG